MSGVLKLGGVTVATEADGAVSLDSTLISNISMSANHAGVKTALNASGNAPIYACRAWVNFVGTSVTDPASTAGINAQGNVDSLFDNGTGDYTINFDEDMPDTNYVVAGSTSDVNRHQRLIMCKQDSIAVGSVRIGINYNDGGGLTDATGHIMICIFR